MTVINNAIVFLEKNSILLCLNIIQNKFNSAGIKLINTIFLIDPFSFNDPNNSLLLIFLPDLITKQTLNKAYIEIGEIKNCNNNIIANSSTAYALIRKYVYEFPFGLLLYLFFIYSYLCCVGIKLVSRVRGYSAVRRHS